MKRFILSLGVVFMLFGCKKDCDNPEECFKVCDNPDTEVVEGITDKDCNCQCNEAFEGENCLDRKTPQSIKIMYIEMLNFDDENWDFESNGSRPDIYLEIKEGDERVTFSSESHEEARVTDEIFFSFNGGVEINMDTYYSIDLYDYDDYSSPIQDRNDDLMNSMTLNILSFLDKKEELILSNSSNEYQYKVYLKYTY